VWSTPAAAKPMTKLGASLVTTPAVRMFEVVSKGTVDAYVSISIGEAHAFKVAQFAKSATLVPGKLLAPTFSFFINPKKWAAISEQDRQLILSVSGEKLARLSRNWEEKEKGSHEEFKAMGKEIIEASPKFAADLERAWRPLHDEWIEEATQLGVDGKAAFAYFIEQSKAVAAERR
jgi:TRAP-type C4-dicarboxylate transport system substrate-binding protein